MLTRMRARRGRGGLQVLSNERCGRSGPLKDLQLAKMPRTPAHSAYEWWIHTRRQHELLELERGVGEKATRRKDPVELAEVRTPGLNVRTDMQVERV